VFAGARVHGDETRVPLKLTRSLVRGIFYCGLGFSPEAVRLLSDVAARLLSKSETDSPESPAVSETLFLIFDAHSAAGLRDGGTVSRIRSARARAKAIMVGAVVLVRPGGLLIDCRSIGVDRHPARCFRPIAASDLLSLTTPAEVHHSSMNPVELRPPAIHPRTLG
jgi:hypothetical protein